MKQINVLIACEESQVECQAFRQRGFNAYSCDVQPCGRAANSEWHINEDVTPFLHGCTTFTTQSGKHIQVERWHLIIAHPPCTYLCKVSSVQLYKPPLEWCLIDGQRILANPERIVQMKIGRSFFYTCLSADAPFVAVENPQPMRIAGLPRPSCFASPHWYGDKYSKRTLYWTKNLPPLMAGATNPQATSLVVHRSGKYRSRTSVQLAQAIATQWGDYVRQAIEDAAQ